MISATSSMAFIGILQKPFISTWDTTKAGSANTHIIIPTISTGSYNCVVDWGDGNKSTISTYNDAAWNHTYSATGVYTVKIYGGFNGIRFNNIGDKLKLMSITQWGTNFRLGTTQGSYLYGCSNLVISATNNLNLKGLTTLTNAFRSCASIVTIPSLNNWNTSAVTIISGMFQGCTLFNQALSFSTISVTDMNSMFASCSAFNSTISFNTATVTSMFQMFFSATIFNQPLAFNTALITNLGNMFFNATAFNQDISAWNTISCANFSSMFQGATAFNQPLPWNTAASSTMSSMFQGATAFNQDISAWNTGNVLNTSSMFSGATSFDQNLGGWNITKTTTMTGMFTSVTLSKANYNALLAGWAAQTTPKTSVTFSGGNSHYDATTGGFNGTAGRLILTTTYTWTITDGGTP